MKNQSATPAVTHDTGAFEPRAAAAEPQPQPQAAAPANPTSREPLHALKGSATRCRHDSCGIDLPEEGANILELKLRQSRCLTPLSISSRATQAILNQF